MVVFTREQIIKFKDPFCVNKMDQLMSLQRDRENVILFKNSMILNEYNFHLFDLIRVLKNWDYPAEDNEKFIQIFKVLFIDFYIFLARLFFVKNNIGEFIFNHLPIHQKREFFDFLIFHKFPFKQRLYSISDHEEFMKVNFKGILFSKEFNFKQKRKAIENIFHKINFDENDWFEYEIFLFNSDPKNEEQILDEILIRTNFQPTMLGLYPYLHVFILHQKLGCFDISPHEYSLIELKEYISTIDVCMNLCKDDYIFDFLFEQRAKNQRIYTEKIEIIKFLSLSMHLNMNYFEEN